MDLGGFLLVSCQNLLVSCQSQPYHITTFGVPSLNQVSVVSTPYPVTVANKGSEEFPTKNEKFSWNGEKIPWILGVWGGVDPCSFQPRPSCTDLATMTTFNRLTLHDGGGCGSKHQETTKRCPFRNDFRDMDDG